MAKPQHAKRSHATAVRFAVAAVLLLGCAGLNALFAQFGSVFFPAYRSISKAVLNVLATITGIVPVAVWDIAVVVALLVVLIGLVVRIVRRRGVLAWLSGTALAVGVVAMLFVGGWALNHYAPPLAEEMELEIYESSPEELAQASAYYLDHAAALALEVPRDENGSLVRQDFFEMARIAGASYAQLAEEHDIFRGPTAPVKALLLYGEPLLYSGHVGIFFAPTGEANVPLNTSVSEMPFVMCHEAAHRLAIASEEEANFASILACMRNSDVRFAYAGYYVAYADCQNALEGVSPELAGAVINAVVEHRGLDAVNAVLGDRYDTYLHYLPYEGPAEEVGTTVNDTYLKTFGEEVGVLSYGLVVDYLIAYFYQQVM